MFWHDQFSPQSSLWPHLESCAVLGATIKEGHKAIKEHPKEGHGDGEGAGVEAS